MKFTVLHRNEINTEKWDDCVSNSSRPLIYGISWYLDAATNNQWDGMVWGDYEAVLPLPFNRKLLKKQLVIPHMIQQLGVFDQHSDCAFDEGEIANFLKKNYIQTELALMQSFQLKSFNKTKRKNYLFHLNREFFEMKKEFKKSTRYYANKLSFTTKYLCPEEFMDFVQTNASTTFRKTNMVEQQLKNVMNACMQQEQGNIIAALDGKDILSAVFYVWTQNRVTTLLSFSSTSGYRQRANAFIIFWLMKTYSKKSLLLDFEGSEVAGVEQFIQNFGAKAEYYYRYAKPSKTVERIKKILS